MLPMCLPSGGAPRGPLPQTCHSNRPHPTHPASQSQPRTGIADIPVCTGVC